MAVKCSELPGTHGNCCGLLLLLLLTRARSSRRGLEAGGSTAPAHSSTSPPGATELQDTATCQLQLALTTADIPLSPHANPFHRCGNRLSRCPVTFSQAAEPGTESRSVTPKPMSLTLPPKCIQFSRGSRRRVPQPRAVPLPCWATTNVVFQEKGCLLLGVNNTEDFLAAHVCFPPPPDVDLGFLTGALLLLKNLLLGVWYGLHYPYYHFLLGAAGHQSSTLTTARAISVNICFLLLFLKDRVEGTEGVGGDREIEKD